MNTVGYKVIVRGRCQTDLDSSGIGVYAGSSVPDATHFLGNFVADSEIKTQVFDVPLDIVGQDYTDLCVVFDNNSFFEYYIYDFHVTVSFLEQTSLETTNTVDVFPYGVPLNSSDIITKNYARLRKGNQYVLDYFTPDNWWGIGRDNHFNYILWNRLEEITNYFGRFLHSPLLFDAPIPHTESFRVSLDGTNILFNDSCPTDTTNIVGGFSFSPCTYSDIGNSFVAASPSVFCSDGTLWFVSVSKDTQQIVTKFYGYDGTSYFDFSGYGSPIVLEENRFLYISLFLGE